MHRRPQFGTRALVLLLGSFLTFGALLVPAVALAAGNTLRIEPLSSTVATGATFTVKVVQNAEVATSGAQATLTFDPARLQVQSVTRGAPYAAAPIFTGAGASAIAAANVSGTLATVAAGFLPPDSVPAGDQEFLIIGFKAIASGVSSIGLPVGPSGAVLLDGRDPTYGDLLAVTTTGGSVTITAPPVAAITALPLWIAGNAVSLHWTGTSTGATVTGYDVRYRRAAWNGAFGAQATWLAMTATTSAAFNAASGYTYCFSVRAWDSNASVSGWTAETCTAIPLDDRSLARTGKWTVATGSAFYRSTYVRSTAKGATLTRTRVVAKRVAIVATTCPTCGAVKVYLGSKLLKTINLKSTKTVNKKLITVAAFTSARAGTIKIQVSSPKGKKVTIDGLVIRRL